MGNRVKTKFEFAINVLSHSSYTHTHNSSQPYKLAYDAVDYHRGTTKSKSGKALKFGEIGVCQRVSIDLLLGDNPELELGYTPCRDRRECELRCAPSASQTDLIDTVADSLAATAASASFLHATGESVPRALRSVRLFKWHLI
jgi:hypothetical protein